jgi:hypothetical protein
MTGSFPASIARFPNAIFTQGQVSPHLAAQPFQDVGGCFCRSKFVEDIYSAFLLQNIGAASG